MIAEEQLGEPIVTEYERFGQLYRSVSNDPTAQIWDVASRNEIAARHHARSSAPRAAAGVLGLRLVVRLR